MGGTSTAVLDTFYAFYTPGERSRRVVGGLGWEVVERLTADGVAFERPNTYGAGTGVTYDMEALKVLWERLAEDAGVELLLHTWATGVRVEKLGDRRWRVSGGTRLDDFRREYPALGEVPGVETMGGLMLRVLETVPTPGESVAFRGLKLTAEVTDERRVRDVLVEVVK